MKNRKKQASEKSWKMGSHFCITERTSIEITSRRAETLASSKSVEWRCFERRVESKVMAMITLGRGSWMDLVRGPIGEREVVVVFDVA